MPTLTRRKRMAGRKRTIEPNPATAEGQCALYLGRLIERKGIRAGDVAKAIGKQRSTIFNYLAGTTTPTDSTRDQLAKALGLRDYRDLMPTDDFLFEIGQRSRRNRRSK